MSQSGENFSGFTHLDGQGRARMVDTGSKPVTVRLARASGRVMMSSRTVDQIRRQQIEKGDVLAAARLAGIMAAKHTATLIPLCHPLGVDAVTVDFEIGSQAVEISTTVKVNGRTGVEMEALVAASVAALTIYDMCKAVDRGMTIESIRLEEKSGGRSGHYLRKESTS